MGSVLSLAVMPFYRLLIVELALANYRDEHGAYPRTLADLVPEELERAARRSVQRQAAGVSAHRRRISSLQRRPQRRGRRREVLRMAATTSAFR